jgi:hypothetical protein
MRQTRVYLPLSRSGLRRVADVRSIDGTTLTAFAVTRQLERAHPGQDEEHLEYLAFGDAAQAALVLREPGDRIVVAAADVEPESVQAHAAPDGLASRVRVTEPVPLRRIVSFHVEEGGAGSEFGGEPELLWYDATELDEVVRMFS